MHLPSAPLAQLRRVVLACAPVALVVLLAACDAGAPAATPRIVPGSSAAPREVNIVMRDYAYVPAMVDLVPGETVVFHMINGGLEVHEAVLGGMEAQLAWETAEAATVGHPPGPTPFVPDPAGFNGIRVVATSGQRLDVTWTVPVTAADEAGGWFVGCHIPGHWAKGMVVPIRWIDGNGVPMAPAPVAPGASATPAVSGDPSGPVVVPSGTTGG